MPKISKAQMAILKELANGSELSVRLGFNAMAWISPKTKSGRVRIDTALALIDRGFVVMTKRKNSIYPQDGEYGLSDTGRSLVEQEAERLREAESDMLTDLFREDMAGKI